MSPHWRNFLLMLWLGYLMITSTLLFTKGFLLSKNAQILNNTCSNCNQDDCIKSALENFQTLKECLPQRARIILIIIDALRYDFAVFNGSLEGPQNYENKLPIINELLENEPEHSRLYKFVADPPTTTMQRLKALTTGSLPTFLDAGSNFATNEINEDNIIDQLLAHNLKTVLIGDDTWDGLYPNRFLRKYPYPSFDVWDLDTVDNGVNSHLPKELQKKDWSFLIAHFLGVDHCGHRYGPSHPEMARKLTEMNAVIEQTVNQLDNQTMLLVIGDHGMTETGNHGGDAQDEINAALFTYSKKQLLNYKTNEVRQVSLVPTLSAIFGISIPFSNLGSVILDTLPKMDHPVLQEWRFSLFYLWSNVIQMSNYIEEYAKTSPGTFSFLELEELRQQLAMLKNDISGVDGVTFDVFARECLNYMVKVRETCERVWVQFDGVLIGCGLTLFFLNVCLLVFISINIPSVSGTFVKYAYFGVFSVISISGILFLFNLVSFFNVSVYLSSGVTSLLFLSFYIFKNRQVINVNPKFDIWDLTAYTLFTLHLIGLFSNSFVVEEASVLLFLTVTLNLLLFIQKCHLEFRKKLEKINWWSLLTFITILVLLRTSRSFWRCRERLEQPWCYQNDNFTKINENPKLQWALSLCVLLILVFGTRIWLKKCGNLNGYSFGVLLIKYIPFVLVFSTSSFWLFDSLPIVKLLWQKNLLAWSVYGLSILTFVTVLVDPLCIYLFKESSRKTIPQVFELLKKKLEAPNQAPVVCGLGTVFSTVFISFSLFLVLIFSLLLGANQAPSVTSMYFVALLSLSLKNSQILKVSDFSITTWLLLSMYFFYATGHQPTFPNILWNAGFVGTSGLTTNLIVPGTLIIIDTFSSHIFMGMLVPMLVIAPLTVSYMLPTVPSLEKLNGEMHLYERREQFQEVCFRTCCKYVFFHGIRVFVSMVAATVHCRHMMIWKIFAPKLIFEAVGLFVTIFVVHLGYLVVVRVGAKLDGFVGSLKRS